MLVSLLLFQGIPLCGDPWGDTGGLECREEAVDMASSAGLLQETSSHVSAVFFTHWGEPAPTMKNKKGESCCTLNI